MLTLRKLAEDATTITLGWTPPADASGYRFSRDGRVVSHTWNGARNSVRFSKGGAYTVETLKVGPVGRYP